MLLCTLLLLVGFGLRAFVACHDLRVLVPTALGSLGLVGIWAVLRFVKVDDYGFVAHVIFPIVLCSLCVANAVFFTPASIPDEEFHYKKAYTMSNLVMGDMDPLEMREEDAVFNHRPELFNGVIEAAYWNELPNVGLFATHEGHRANISQEWSYDLGTDPPQFRLASMLGIMVGKSLGLSGYVTFLLGRLFNALCAVALIALAVRLAPVGKNALMAVALLPMCLHLIGSYSYDAGYIGLGMLTTALLLRLFYGERPVSAKLMVGFLICSALLAPGKVVYVVIGLLGALVPSDRFRSKRCAICFKLAVVLIPLACALLPSFARISGLLGSNPSAGAGALDARGAEKGTFYTLGDIVAHPLASLLFLVKSLVARGYFLLMSLVGGSLGWFQRNIKAPNWLVALFFATLLLGVVRAKDDDSALSRSLRIGLVVASVIGALGVVLSMWTGWTFVTDEYIHGLQGRYVLPFVPGVLLAIRPKRLSTSWPLGFVIVMSSLSLECLYLSRIFCAVQLA